MDTLTQYDFFRYVILVRKDGALFGMLDARSLQAAFGGPRPEGAYSGFASELNRAAPEDLERIASLPGFVPASEAVNKQADKREVLSRLQKSGRDWLPVIGDNGRFEGVVDQSRLVASMILDVADQLKTAPAQP
jgi:CBS-domain-containing membrane protein